MWLGRGWPLLIVAILCGCQTPPTAPYSSSPPPIQVRPPIIDTDKIEKKNLVLDLPAPPANGARAFFGIKIRDCKRNGKQGAYVAGYFFMYEKSPAKEAGILIGDEIIEINDNRIGINAVDLDNYITRVAFNVMYKFKIIRDFESKVFEVKSIKRFPGIPVLTQTATATCQAMRLLDL